MENLVKKIIVQLGDIEVSLTPEQIKKLHNELDLLLNNGVRYVDYQKWWVDWSPVRYGSGIYTSNTTADYININLEER